jgi:hypothetical protein
LVQVLGREALALPAGGMEIRPSAAAFRSAGIGMAKCNAASDPDRLRRPARPAMAKLKTTGGNAP